MDLLNKVRYLPIRCMVIVGCCAGCSDSSDDSSSSNPTYSSTSPSSAGTYDALAEFSSGQTAPEVIEVGKFLGLDNLTLPRDKYIALGYIGVAPLEARCVVTITPEGADSSVGHISVIVYSRYDLRLELPLANVPIENLKRSIDETRPRCRS